MSRRRVVMIVAESGAPEGDEALTLWLRRPFEGCEAAFLDRGGTLLETQRVDFARPASWFVEQTVQSDGSMLVCTPFDVDFLVVAALERVNETGFTWEELLVADSNIKKLERFDLRNRLAKFCEKVGDNEDEILIPESKKIKSWFQGKVERLSKFLEEKEMIRKENNLLSMRDGATLDPSFNLGKRSFKYFENDVQKKAKRNFTEEAVTLLQNFVTPQMFSKLSRVYEIMQEVEAAEAAAAAAANTEEGKEKNMEEEELNEFIHDVTKGIEGNDGKKKKGEMTTAHKILAKVDTRGMASISSFFGKK